MMYGGGWQEWEGRVANTEGVAESGVLTAEREVQAPAKRAKGGRQPRPLKRRQSLPGGRAVVGGFLVAVALVGTFAAYTSATHDTRVGYLVASHDLTIGSRIGTADLAFAKMQLPSGKNHAFRNPETLIGATVIGPVAEGELIQTSEVIDKRSGADDREVSIPIDPARAVGGHLAQGDLVDLLFPGQHIAVPPPPPPPPKAPPAPPAPLSP